MSTIDTLWDYIVAALGVLLTWMYKAFNARITSLETRVEAEQTERHRIEILVAGQYVTRQEMKAQFDVLFSKLDSISNKLDHKQDR